MTDDDDRGPEADDAVFAENMASLRTTFGISQADLVKRLNELGWTSVYQTTISRIEKGDRPVRVGEARAIARALGVDLGKMTLPRKYSLLASRLSRARTELAHAEETIHRGTRDWLNAQRKLDRLIGEARREGIEPSAIPPQPEDDPLSDRLITPVTVEDQVAAAVSATQRTLERAIEMGRIYDELEQSRITGDSLT